MPSFWKLFERFTAAAKAAAAAAQRRGSADSTLDCAAPCVYSRSDLTWLASALERGTHELCDAVAVLRARALAVAAAVDRGAVPAPGVPCSRALRDGFENAVHAAVLSTAACPFGELLGAFYGQMLAAFAAAKGRPVRGEAGGGSDSDGDDGDAMEGVEGGEAVIEDTTFGAGSEWHRQALHVTASLATLGLAPLAEEALAGALAAAVRSRLTHAARGVFDAAALAPARRWLAAVPFAFVALLLPSLHPGDAAQQQLATWRARLEYALHTALGALRASELFDIIVDFPDSRPALDDLRACLAHTSLAASLAASFRAALARRLLHAGAATADILTQYVSTIKALRELDPSGLLLEAVSEPLRAYLRSRKDTIRCVVTLLTDASADGGAAGEGLSLMEELAADDGAAAVDDVDSDVEGDAPPRDGWDTWTPPPVHVGTAMTSGSAGGASAQPRGRDVVSLLVGIFGSRELFIAEYRAALAERLLARRGYDAERDVRTLELLKLRFGDAPLHSAEVMLKDVADSKRIDANVKARSASGSAGGDSADQQVDAAVCATVISQLFWPPFGADATAELALPQPVEMALSRYAARFEALKAPRKLLWRKTLGAVALELRLGGETRTFNVSPPHAALVWRFSERDAWRADELAAALQLPLPALRKRAALWVNAGVLRESRDASSQLVFTVADAFGDAEGAVPGAGGGEDAGGAVASAEEQAAAEMAVYEQYVIGMLTNFDSLSLERIHNMLKMFVSEPPYDKSAAELEALLSRLVADEKLTLDRGSYRRRTT